MTAAAELARRFGSLSTCAACRHSRPHVERGPVMVNVAQGESLQCWRYPPVPFGTFTPQGIATGSLAPIVSSGSLCGEFAPKPDAAN